MAAGESWRMATRVARVARMAAPVYQLSNIRQLIVKDFGPNVDAASVAWGIWATNNGLMPRKPAHPHSSRQREWHAQGLQLPGPVYKAFKAEAGTTRLGTKRIGAAAVAAYLGLDPMVRKLLLLWLDMAASQGEEHITPQGAATVLRAALKLDSKTAEAADMALALAAAMPEVLAARGDGPTPPTRASEGQNEADIH